MTDLKGGVGSRLGRLSAGQWLAVILVVSVCIRIALAFYLGDTIGEIRGGTYDQVTYDALAQRVVAGQGFSFDRAWWPATRAGEPTAHWSYPYTLFLAGVYWGVGHHPLVARILQAIAVGVLMPLLLYRIGSRTFGQRTGLIAAAIAAAYFYFAHYAASLMTESFYIVAMLWTLDATMRLAGNVSEPGFSKWRYGLELGAAVGLALLLRQVFVVMLLVMVAWLLWFAWRRARLRSVFLTLAVAAGVCAFLVIPWLVRSYLAFDMVTFMPNTNSGFAFYWANHPIYGTRFEAVLGPQHGVSYRDLIPPELLNLSELALDRALLARGLQFVVDDPGRYVLLSLSRIPVYFKFWPTPDSTLLSNAARVLSFGLFLPFMLFGLFLAIRDLWRHRAGRALRTLPAGEKATAQLQGAYVVLLLLLMVAYSGVHIVSWANVRYRLPVDALLILFAASAIDYLVARLVTIFRRKAPA